MTKTPAPIQIRCPDVIEEARQLAALTGLTVTEAIGRAVRAQLAIEKVAANKALSERFAEAQRARSLPIEGPGRSDDDLYDPDALPE
jgi:hypothetical protein